MEDSFWDIEKSGQVESAGGTGRNPKQMRHPRTYETAGWDIEQSSELRNEAYPYLSWKAGRNSPTWYITGPDHHNWPTSFVDPEQPSEPVTEVYSYPNPFVAGGGDPLTFYVPVDYGERITLELYSLTGHRILSRTLEVSNEEASWNPELSSGTYIYLIKGGGYSSSGNFTIIR